MEANRVWHEPVVEIYGNAIGPGALCEAGAYDLGNRRWYMLRLKGPGVPEDEVMSNFVAKHIKSYYEAHSILPPWNVIEASSNVAEAEEALFETLPERRVARPFRKRLTYGTQANDRLPTTSFETIQDKIYLARGADRCSWDGKDCVYKRIEFDCDVKTLVREIESRETLLRDLDDQGIEASGDSLLQHYCVAPILAVVLSPSSSTATATTDDDGAPPPPPVVSGLLLPFMGQTLEEMVRAPGITAATATLTNAERDLPVDRAQLAALVRGVRQMGKSGVLHGDIKFWNTTLHHQDQARRRGGGGGGDRRGARLVLIDLGDIAPEYKGDAAALGDLLLWCAEHSLPLNSGDSGEAKRVHDAAAALRKDGDFDRAVNLLEE